MQVGIKSYDLPPTKRVSVKRVRPVPNNGLPELKTGRTGRLPKSALTRTSATLSSPKPIRESVTGLGLDKKQKIGVGLNKEFLKTTRCLFFYFQFG